MLSFSSDSASITIPRFRPLLRKRSLRKHGNPPNGKSDPFRKQLGENCAEGYVLLPQGRLYLEHVSLSSSAEHTPADRTAMTKPASQPITPEQARELALAVIQSDRFPHLATIDGDQPRLR